MKKIIVYNQSGSILKIGTLLFKADSELELAKEEADKLCKLYPHLLTLNKKKNGKE